MWFTTIQISPRTIGLMVEEFHWIWATEWTFFGLEVVSGYMFYRYGARLDDRSRFTLLLTYAFAAWMSLFLINGILSWQLTPGGWTESRNLWSGFFNPSFWPSLLYRTVAAMTIAALIACVVVNTMTHLDQTARTELVQYAAHFAVGMIFMPALGVWFIAVMPEDSRSWVLGGSVAMTLFMILAVGASLLIGLYAVIGLFRRKLSVNGATAALLCALAFGATAGGEFVREGSRKPYTVRQELFANSLTQAEVDHLRVVGCVTNDPYPLRDASAYPTEQLRLGMKVFRFHCSVCHTVRGANGLTQLTGSWTIDQKRLNISKLQHTKPFMPPFAGTARELEALVQTLSWEVAGRPKQWPLLDDPTVLAQIGQWLDEAGTQPGWSRELPSAAPETR